MSTRIMRTERRRNSGLAAVVMLFAVAMTIIFTGVLTEAASTRKGYLIGTKNVTVYKNSTLKGTTIGTVYPSDEIQILDVNSTCSKITYPVTNSKGTITGYKTGYIKTGEILTRTSFVYTQKAQAKITTYRRNGGATYGYISKNDQVNVLGAKGNYTQVKYPVSGGFKYAFITTSDLNKYLPKKLPTPTPVPTGSTASANTRSEKLAKTAESQIGYQGVTSKGTGKGDYTKYGKWIGSNGNQWCAAFVSWCVNQSGVSTAVVPKTQSTLTMGQKSNSYNKWSGNATGKLKRGDVIFFSTTNSLTTSKGAKAVHHVGIVTRVNKNQNLIEIVEGNTGSDVVARRSYTVNPSTGKITSSLGGYWNGEYFCGFISVK